MEYMEKRSGQTALKLDGTSPLLENQLKKEKATVKVLTVLLFLVLIVGAWMLGRLEQMTEKMEDLLTDAQQLFEEKTVAERELAKVRQELSETENQFRDSFNLLYPAFEAVGNIRYVGKNSQVYHYFSCELFVEYETYTAHNTEYCDLLGYTPCPACCQ